MNDILKDNNWESYPEVYSKLRALEQAGVKIHKLIFKNCSTKQVFDFWVDAIESYVDAHFDNNTIESNFGITINAVEAIRGQYHYDDDDAREYILTPFLDMIVEGGHYIELANEGFRWFVELDELEDALNNLFD